MTGKTPVYPILMVDDEQEILFSSTVMLRNAVPNRILTLDDSSKVLPLLQDQEMAVIVLDLHMPGMSGLELLQRITYDFPQTPVLVLTAANDIEMAVACMKAGAFDYLVKPADKSRLVTSVLRALEVHFLRSEVNSLKHHLLNASFPQAPAFAPIITRSPRLHALFRYVESICNSPQPVLISGETGVGKELFAKAIHDVSGREGRFVSVNIAGLDDQMFSATLFGHRKGAFTGADHAREGLIAAAAGGTLFLDEIGDMSAATQVKLLRLLQENEYYPLGSDVAKRSTARVVVATNRDLQQMIAAGNFRNDLYYRLCAHSCRIPPFRERLEDLPLLMEHFLQTAAADMHKDTPPYPPELVAFLATYSFPGNIRELQAMIYDAVARHSGPILSLDCFREKIGLSQAPSDVFSGPGMNQENSSEMQVFFPTFPSLKEAEELLVARALAIARNNQGIAASLLGITRQALNNRLVRKQRSLS